MPGIAGIIGVHPLQKAKGMVDLMVNCMNHEQFYTSGSYANDVTGVAVGWANHKDSFSDCAPIWNETRNICLIFTGQDFADQKLVDDLKSKGHVFNPENASRLVHLYEEFGPEFMAKINGWFSGILIDLRQGKILLFNDRYGINRVYYHETKGGFYFSSEAKSLLKVLPELRTLAPESLGEFFSCGAVLQNRSLFRGVSMIPGGAVWTFGPGGDVQKGFYFKKESWEELPELTASDYYERLLETWTRILPRYFNGQERAALSLTWGVDSRMILACAPPGSLPCYTFGGMYRDCADVTISRQVAKVCMQPYETIPLNGNFLAEFPALVEKSVYISDGTLDPTGAADLFVNRVARRMAPVRITGLNGGELLRRLVMFKPEKRIQWDPVAPEVKGHIEAAAATYAQELQGHRLSFITFKQAPWYLYARLSLERSQLTIRTPYFDNDLVALSFQSPPDMRGIEPALRLIAQSKPALKELGTDRASLLNSTFGITQLHHQLQEFTFKAEYAYDYGMPQWLARMDHLLAPLRIEKLFLGRHKFNHFRIWYRDELSGYLQEILLDSLSRSRSYVNAAVLEKSVRAHISGRANHTVEIHRLLTLELLQRQMLDQN
jgi:asparagine synthase (glutamine-hydrolysing)